MSDDKMWEVLLQIKASLGALENDAASSQRQRANLYDKVEQVQSAVAEVRSGLNAATVSTAALSKDVAEIKKDLSENVKPVISMFSSVKSKGVMVLTAIALMGGTIGGQAEALLKMFLGKAP